MRFGIVDIILSRRVTLEGKKKSNMWVFWLLWCVRERKRFGNIATVELIDWQAEPVGEVEGQKMWAPRINTHLVPGMYDDNSSSDI